MTLLSFVAAAILLSPAVSAAGGGSGGRSLGIGTRGSDSIADCGRDRLGHLKRGGA